jgi:hypothetical protein
VYQQDARGYPVAEYRYFVANRRALPSGVALTAIDSVCNRKSIITFMAIGYTPQGP